MELPMYEMNQLIKQAKGIRKIKKNEDFFNPVKARDSCEEQEWKYLLPKKCNSAAVK